MTKPQTEEWHTTFDKSVELAGKLERDVDPRVRQLARAVIWLSENMGRGAVAR